MDLSIFQGRIKNLSKKLQSYGLEGVIIVPGPNMYYYTGVKSILLERPFMLFIWDNSDVSLLAPELESGPYRRLGINVYPWSDDEGPEKALEAICRRITGKWGIDGKMPFGYYSILRKWINKTINADGILLAQREIKDDKEIRLVRKSSQILSNAFQKLPELMSEGMKESELAKKMTDLIYSFGADSVEDVLVQSGKRASDPHSLPTSKKIMRDELVVVDISSTYNGYFSDITRTVSISKPKDAEEVYETVLLAQTNAIKSCFPGAKAEDIDVAARETIKSRGYESYFIHRTGHGLGLEVHEQPYIVSGNKEEIKEGMVFTVEPGIYIKNRLGIRIEDDILIGSRAEEITKVPKEYLWWL